MSCNHTDASKSRAAGDSPSVGFLHCHIAAENIGRHELWNGFFLADGGVRGQLRCWQEYFDGCTLVGVCLDGRTGKVGGYFPMVFEDTDGNRFYTHIPYRRWKDEIEGWQPDMEVHELDAPQPCPKSRTRGFSLRQRGIVRMDLFHTVQSDFLLCTDKSRLFPEIPAFSLPFLILFFALINTKHSNNIGTDNYIHFMGSTWASGSSVVVWIKPFGVVPKA